MQIVVQTKFLYMMGILDLNVIKSLYIVHNSMFITVFKNIKSMKYKLGIAEVLNLIYSGSLWNGDHGDHLSGDHSYKFQSICLKNSN